MVLMQIVSLRSIIVKVEGEGREFVAATIWTRQRSMGPSGRAETLAKLGDHWCVVTPVYSVVKLTSLLTETEWERLD